MALASRPSGCSTSYSSTPCLSHLPHRAAAPPRQPPLSREGPGSARQARGTPAMQPRLSARRRRDSVVAAASPKASVPEEPDMFGDDILDEAEEMLGEDGVKRFSAMRGSEEEEEDGGGAEVEGDGEQPETVEEEEFEELLAELGLAGGGGEGEEGEEGEAGAWDAALVNFPAEQDVAAMEQQLQQRVEWQDSLERVAMRRIGPRSVMDAPPSEPNVAEDVTAPEEPPPPPRQPGDQYKLLTRADQEKLVRNRQAYTSFELEGVELLVAEESDGLMDLADSFVLDPKADMFDRPLLEGNLPQAPARYQVIPWREEFAGDTLKGKDPESRLLRVYFLGVQSTEPYQVNFSQLYCFDGSRRALCEVPVWGYEGVVQPVLRIRAGVAWVDDAFLAADPAQVAMNLDEGEALDLAIAREAAQANGSAPGAALLLPSGDEVDERLEELDRGLEDDLDDVPDLPAVDMV